MTIKHACFISYRHFKKDVGKTFVDQLVDALENYLDFSAQDYEVYVDRPNLEAGDLFEPKLAKALCQSAVLIMVLTEEYFNEVHNFCTREYLAMKELQARRFEILGMQDPDYSLIIPIIFNSDLDCLPEEIADIQAVDFSDWPLAQKSISEHYPAQIQEIVSKISRLTKFLAKRLPIGENQYCINEFNLPSADHPEVERLISEYQENEMRVIEEEFYLPFCHPHKGAI